MTWLTFISFFCFVALQNSSCQEFYEHEQNIRQEILTDNSYKYKIRPEENTEVVVKMHLLNINNLDVPTQQLSVSGWLTITWNDKRLVWDPATKGDIPDIYDTESVFWRPELIVDNSIDDLGVIADSNLLIRATYLGNMTWEPPGIYTTHCDVDITYYPFDTQICIVEVTSWAYTLEEVHLKAGEEIVNQEDYHESGEWDVIETWTEEKTLLDNGEEHSQVDFFMRFRRKPSYYVTTILIPVIVTSILCVIVFALPVESGEKVGYSLTILLTYTVMLTLVASYLPPTSKHTSLLSVYLTIILFIGVFSTLLTVLSLYLYHQDPETMPPPSLQSIFRGCLAPLGCFKKKTNKVTPTSPKVEPKEIPKIKASFKRQSTQADILSLDDNEDFTWIEMSRIVDRASYRIVGAFVGLLTIIVILTLTIAYAVDVYRDD